MKALVGAFNQEKALVGAFSVIVQPVVKPIGRFAALFLSPVLQGPYRPRRPRVALLAEVCGRGHPVTWLLPCHTSDTRDWEPLQNYDV